MTCRSITFNMFARPWGRVLQKLMVAQMVKKFPAVYGAVKLIIVLTIAHRYTLSWARWIQSIFSYYFLRSILLSLSRIFLVFQVPISLQVFWLISFRYFPSLMRATFPTQRISIDFTTVMSQYSLTFCLKFTERKLNVHVLNSGTLHIVVPISELRTV